MVEFRQISSLRMWPQRTTLHLKRDFQQKSYKDVAKRQELRQSTLKNVCHAWNETFIPPNLFKFLLLDVKHNVLYAEIPKVASTNWLHIMINKTNTVHVDFVDRRKNKFDFLNRKFLERIGLRYLDQMSELDAETILNNSTYKFVFVRHPFDRLVSAFRSKINPGIERQRRRNGAAILRMFRPNETLTVIQSGRGVKFHEFVRWILYLESAKLPLDEHWCPYYRLCHPCQVHYDFIGKYETLSTDAAEVLKQAYHVTDIPFPVETKQHKTGVDGSVTAAYFKEVLPEDTQKLKQMYRYDFKLFGYDPDSY